MEFANKLSNIWHKNNSLLSVGLDPDSSVLPSQLAQADQPLYDFNKSIIDATADLVCSYKLNTAFYEAHGNKGIVQLKLTMEYLQNQYADLPIIIDAKRADIGNTNNGTIDFVFEYLGADAVTVNPYMGKEALEPFLSKADKGIIVLCRTSNPGAAEFQDKPVDGVPLYQVVARNVVESWNGNNNCSLVVGATFPEAIKAVREITGPEMVLLLPGVGTQGGDLKQAVQAAVNADGTGMIINSSRGILYASGSDDYATAARQQAMKLRDEINSFR